MLATLNYVRYSGEEVEYSFNVDHIIYSTYCQGECHIFLLQEKEVVIDCLYSQYEEFMRKCIKK